MKKRIFDLETQVKPVEDVRSMVTDVLCHKDNADRYHQGNPWCLAFAKALNTPTEELSWK